MLIPAGDLVFRADSYRQETGVGGGRKPVLLNYQKAYVREIVNDSFICG